MSREEIKNYLIATIDAMSDEDLTEFVFPEKDIDLYTLAEEITSLKSEVKKTNNVSMKLNSNIQNLIENSEKKIENDNIDADLKNILLKIANHNELSIRTKHNFDELPELSFLNLSSFKKHFYAWKSGYEIYNEMWGNLLKDTGLKPTGKNNELFNPEFHEVIDTEQNSDIENNIILDTQDLGYMYKNILLKRAKVVVNKKNSN